MVPYLVLAAAALSVGEMLSVIALHTLLERQFPLCNHQHESTRPASECLKMDQFKSPSLHLTKTPSATFPLTHGSTRPNEITEPTAPVDRLSPSRNETDGALDSTGSRHRSSHRHLSDWHLDGVKSHSRHKHSKSRELRFPRPMSHLASSASARGLLPTWSGSRERDRDGDNALLRPVTQETSRSRWGSDSTSGVGSSSRRGSLLDPIEQQERLGPIRRQQIQSVEELEQVKKRRKQDEQ